MSFGVSDVISKFIEELADWLGVSKVASESSQIYSNFIVKDFRGRPQQYGQCQWLCKSPWKSSLYWLFGKLLVGNTVQPHVWAKLFQSRTSPGATLVSPYCGRTLTGSSAFLEISSPVVCVEMSSCASVLCFHSGLDLVCSRVFSKGLP